MLGDMLFEDLKRLHFNEIKACLIQEFENELFALEKPIIARFKGKNRQKFAFKSNGLGGPDPRRNPNGRLNAATELNVRFND